MSWATKKIVHIRPQTIPELGTSGVVGFVVVHGPAWNARLVSVYNGKVFDSPVPAFTFPEATRDLLNKEKFDAFEKKVVWGETEAEFFGRVIAKLRQEPGEERHPGKIPVGVTPLILDEDQFGEDAYKDGRTGKRRWRQCWRLVNGKIEVDMPLARIQRLEELREERNSKLKESDPEMMKFLERGPASDRVEWATYRQSLRDLPSAVEVALGLLTTPAQLEAYNPNWPSKPV